MTPEEQRKYHAKVKYDKDREEEKKRKDAENTFGNRLKTSLKEGAIETLSALPGATVRTFNVLK